MSRGRYIGTVVPIAIGMALLLIAIMCAGEDRTANNGPSGREEKEGAVTDIDGNGYHTVTIGTQVWMVENLKVTRYRDGTAIPCVLNEDEWSTLVTGAYCLPERESSAYKDTYGLLYNFHAVSDSCGLCPEGWHVPTATEWRTLIDYLGGTDVAGGKMKETSSGLWKVSVRGATNESGFSGLPAGGRGRLGSVGEVGNYATWWSSTSYDSIYAWHWGLHPDKNSIRSNPGHTSSGFSVRCIKD